MKTRLGEIVIIPQKHRRNKIGIVIERIESDLGIFLGVYAENKKFFIKEKYVQRR